MFFQFYTILICLGCQGGEMAKNHPKWQKILSVVSYISGNIYHIFINGTHVCMKGSYLQAFFSFFQNFDFQDH